MDTAARATRVWDLPTRLFHWALALTVLGLLTTGLLGWMEWHFRLGYGALALLVFRVIWGFVGGRWSRFGAFIYAPATLRAYLRGQGHPHHDAGHSPLGALSVWAMLLLLLAQVATGLVSDNEVDAAGPLANYVSGALVGAASKWHVVWGKYGIITLLVLHVAAILFYTLARRRPLVRAMLDGDKPLPMAVPASRDDAASRGVALLLFAACVALAWWISSLRT